MFKYILFVGMLLSFNVNAETSKLELQTNILKAQGLNLFISVAPFNTIKNITPELIVSGTVTKPFYTREDVDVKKAIEEFVVDKKNSLIVNKEGVAFNVYRYKDEIKILYFEKQ